MLTHDYVCVDITSAHTCTSGIRGLEFNMITHGFCPICNQLVEVVDSHFAPDIIESIEGCYSVTEHKHDGLSCIGTGLSPKSIEEDDDWPEDPPPEPKNNDLGPGVDPLGEEEPPHRKRILP